MEAVQTIGGAAGRPDHNLNGQKLGRKGRETRDRILGAAQALLENEGLEPITLSAIARKADLRMAALYNYFGDLTEVLLAVLEPVMAEAETAYVNNLRQSWDDEALFDECLEFVTRFHAFWLRHTRVLHLRNSLADTRDERMAQQRISSASPVIEMLVAQMNKDASALGSSAFGMATVLYAGIERIVTIATDMEMQSVLRGNFAKNIESYLRAEARLLELGIRDFRSDAA